VKPYLEKPFTKNMAGGVAQGEGPEFKPQYCKKKKKQNQLLPSNRITVELTLFLVVSYVRLCLSALYVLTNLILTRALWDAIIALFKGKD
jgi:hypothetical protein